MGLADDLTQLKELRGGGALTEDDVRRAKARVLDGPPPPPDIPAVAAISRWRRSRSDRWIGGVCGGLAVITGVESWIWRLILFTLALFGGTGVLLYLLLWIFVPNE